MDSENRGLNALNRMGTFTFDNRSTSQPDSANFGAWGQGFATFLLGDVYDGNRLISNTDDTEREQQFQMYVQDDIKVMRRLTLNLGLSYTVMPPFSDPHGRISEFSPTTPNPGAGNIPGAKIFGRNSAAGTYWKAFAPRLGFAFALDSHTVVRGGNGIYYGFAPASFAIDGIPREGYTYIQDVSTSTLGITPAFNINNGFPALNVTLPRLDPALSRTAAP